MAHQRRLRLAAALALGATVIVPRLGLAATAIAGAGATIVEPMTVEATGLAETAARRASAGSDWVVEPPLDAVRVTLAGTDLSCTRVRLDGSPGERPQLVIELE